MRHEYRELKIWQDARELTKIVYETSRKFPSEEKFGLTSQIRRATISIASNISEGSSYRTDSMFLRFLDVALGSLCEVETQLYLAFDVNYLSEDRLNDLLDKTDKLKRMIISFMNRINSTKA